MVVVLHFFDSLLCIGSMECFLLRSVLLPFPGVEFGLIAVAGF